MGKPFYSSELHGINRGLKVIKLICFMKGMSYLDIHAPILQVLEFPGSNRIRQMGWNW